MALRGNLRDFSLPDVFQLVTLSQKTGVLRIKSADAEGSIWFRDGDVFFAQSNWRRDPLGQRLVSAGKVTPSALARCLEIRGAEPPEGRRLGQILVDEGFITSQVLEAFVQEQIQDTIFDLMRWDEGDFDFEPLDDGVDEDIGLTVSIENVIMEGSRRLEEWTRIKKKIPSMDIVFKMATAPGEGTFEISLKPVEWMVLLRIDGTRSVAQIAREMTRTDFEIARVVYGLFAAGLLEVAPEEEVERLRAERAEREARRQKPTAAPAAAQAAAPAPAQQPTPAAPVAPAPSVEGGRTPEEPEFLSADKSVPSAEDMAVFEQMMGAVLDTGAAQPAAEPAVSEAPVAEETVAPPMSAPAEEVPPAAPPETEFFEAPMAQPPEVPEGAPAAPAAVPPGFEPSGDFEADVYALGLGELPTEDLLEPMAPELPVEEEIEAPQVEPMPAASEIPSESEEDLSELLSSLSSEAPVEGTIRTETTESETTGVISTDAFMAEFDDIGLSSGLGDELTALTGGGSGRTRPVATVNKIPDASHDVTLHRDNQVDKGLLMKIIQGIEKL